jgi:hypothetical protein
MFTPRQLLIPATLSHCAGAVGSLSSASVRLYPAAIVACRLQLIAQAFGALPRADRQDDHAVPGSLLSNFDRAALRLCAGQATADSGAAGQRMHRSRSLAPWVKTTATKPGPAARSSPLAAGVEGFRTDDVAEPCSSLAAGMRARRRPRCTASLPGSGGSSFRPPSDCCILTARSGTTPTQIQRHRLRAVR